MVDFLSFPIDLIKVYLLMFFLFDYNQQRKILPILIPSVLIFGMIAFFSQYYSVLGNYLSTISLFFILSITTFQSGSVKKIGEILVFMFCLTIGDMVFTGVIFPYFSGETLEHILNNDLLLFLSNSISLLVIIMVVVLKSILYRNRNWNQLDLSLMELQSILICVISGTFLFAVAENRNKMNLNEKILLISGTVFVTLFLSLVYFIWSNRYSKRMNAIQSEFNDQQKKYNAEILSKYSEKRKFQHDIVNHLLCIEELSRLKKYEELEKYISSITYQYKKTKLLIQTNNYIVDVIASDLLGKYAEKNVSLQWNGKFRQKVYITDPDLSSLFSNLLRNAFEAAELVDESRVVHVDIKYLGENLVIHISNPYRATSIFSKNEFLVTRKNKEYHGFGNLIVESIVKKYSGQIEYSVNNDIFRVDLLFMS